MSGGAFDYVSRVDDVRQLVVQFDDLKALAAALENAGPSLACRQTQGLIGLLVAAEIVFGDLRRGGLLDVWKAVEWRQSGDWGSDRLQEAINAYEGAAYRRREA